MDELAAYEFIGPGRILFGWGRRRELAAAVAGWGRRALVLCGSRTLARSGLLEEMLAPLRQAGVNVELDMAPPREPEVADVDRLVSEWQSRGVGAGDFVVAIGGGSTLDLGKACATMATNGQGRSVVEFLEGVGTGRQITQAPLPLVALPTTAGTGSEATKNAVISSYSPTFKKSLRSPLMLPRLALVDPELTCSLPPDITAATGLDALTQLIESYISRRAQPLPQALALSGLTGFPQALRTAYHNPTDRPSRERLAHGALLSGLALANSGLGLAHGVAAGLGVLHRVPHGVACAMMLPVALRVNAEVCEVTLSRVCETLTGETGRSARESIALGIALIEELLVELQVPRRLREFGVTPTDLPALVQASRGNSLAGNPRLLTDAELLSVLESCQ